MKSEYLSKKKKKKERREEMKVQSRPTWFVDFDFQWIHVTLSMVYVLIASALGQGLGKINIQAWYVIRKLFDENQTLTSVWAPSVVQRCKNIDQKYEHSYDFTY